MCHPLGWLGHGVRVQIHLQRFMQVAVDTLNTLTELLL
jgi:hypothetical protein